MKYLKTNAAVVGFLALAVIFNALMDVMDFRMPRGSGFWSIDSSLFLDAWHLFKYLMWSAVLAAAVWKRSRWGYIIIMFAILNLALHEIILHGIF